MSSSAEPTVEGARRSRPSRPRRAPVSRLGLILMAPALLLLTLFFFLPVALTGVFAFTDLSTSTGIGRGDYVVTPTLLRELGDQGLSDADIASVSRRSVTVNAAALDRARAAGIGARFLDDIEDDFAGRSYDDPSAFERDLRRLRTAPRRARDLKSAAALFETSVLNQRFATSTALAARLETVAPDLPEAARAQIVEASYTGARFTTENFRRLATQKETARLVGNTFLYVGATLSLFNVGLGLFLAVVLFYMPKGASALFSTLWLLPRITPVVLYAVMWKWFTWEDGFLPILAEQLGLPSFNYMKGSVVTAWATMITLNGFIGASFGLILFSGALRAIPVQQLWASEVDGATRWQQVRRIVLPQMRWPILFVTAYQTLSLLSSYEQIWLTTNGGPGRTTTVWALEAFKTALSNYTGNLEYGMGAAMALVLVVVGLVLSLIYLRLFKFNELVGHPKIEI